MTPDDPRHGTEAGHEQHHRDNEPPCEPCYRGKLNASRRRTKRKTMGYRYMVPVGVRLHSQLMGLRADGARIRDIATAAGVSSSVVCRVLNEGPEYNVYSRTWTKLAAAAPAPVPTPLGVTRRIQALFALGYGAEWVAREAGCCKETITDARDHPREYYAKKVIDGVVAAYDRLCMTPATSDARQVRAGITRARRFAQRQGFAPPLAWDDIDTDPAPNYGTKAPTRGARVTVDQGLVARVLAGEVLQLNTAERREVMARWIADGRTENSLTERMNWRHGRYTPRKDAA